MKLQELVDNIAAGFVAEKRKFSAYDVTVAAREQANKENLVLDDCFINYVRDDSLRVVDAFPEIEHSRVKLGVKLYMDGVDSYEMSHGHYITYVPKQEKDDDDEDALLAGSCIIATDLVAAKGLLGAVAGWSNDTTQQNKLKTAYNDIFVKPRVVEFVKRAMAARRVVTLKSIQSGLKRGWVNGKSKSPSSDYIKKICEEHGYEVVGSNCNAVVREKLSWTHY